MNRCPRCGEPIDVDHQSSASGHALVFDDITDPFTGETHFVYYCEPCAVVEFPGLRERMQAAREQERKPTPCRDAT